MSVSSRETERPARSCRPRIIVGQAANLLSASRCGFAALWLTIVRLGWRSPTIFGPLAVAAIASDILDGRVARATGTAGAFGRWLDSVADVVFVLTALACDARAGALPVYIPALVAASFAQYALDSVLIRNSAVPVSSRLGHWGGILNYGLVMLLAIAPPPSRLATWLCEISPLLATFYLAAIVERGLSYSSAISLSVGGR